MSEPATVTPIGRKKTASVPKVELVKVTELPELAKKPKLADAVEATLRDVDLGDDWYQVITYPVGNGAGRTASVLSKDARFAGFEFAGRGNVVYVRAKQPA